MNNIKTVRTRYATDKRRKGFISKSARVVWKRNSRYTA